MYLFQYIDEIYENENENDNDSKETEPENNDVINKMSPIELLIYWFINADVKDNTIDYVNVKK
tara:strand:- start:84 stop:272 length:189 start_codon:yes stop_codon:yes gene_type:complete